MSIIGAIADQAAGGAAGAPPSGSNASADSLGSLFDQAIGDVARAEGDGGKTDGIVEQPGGGAADDANGFGKGNPKTLDPVDGGA